MIPRWQSGDASAVWDLTGLCGQACAKKQVIKLLAPAVGTAGRQLLLPRECVSMSGSLRQEQKGSVGTHIEMATEAPFTYRRRVGEKFAELPYRPALLFGFPGMVPPKLGVSRSLRCPLHNPREGAGPHAPSFPHQGQRRCSEVQRLLAVKREVLAQRWQIHRGAPYLWERIVRHGPAGAGAAG